MFQRSSSKKILLCAGGTGGHLFPAIALAQRLKKLDWKVGLITDQRGTSYVPDELFDSIFVLSSGHGTKTLRHLWRTLMALMASLRDSFLILKRFAPQILWGFGGSVSFVPLLAGFVFRIPSGIYQADAVLGRANRWLLSFTQKIATGFQKTLGLKTSQKTCWVGFPVRDSVLPSPYLPPTPSEPFRLLILGGSQGAQVFSNVIPKAIALLDSIHRKRLHLLQQCRSQLLAETEKRYRSTGVSFSVIPFIEEIGDAMANAHWVITRAGASTIGELSHVGRPALFVPYPYATQNHQTKNARCIVEGGGGQMMSEKNFTPEAVASLLKKMLSDPAPLKKMACQIQSLNRPDTVSDLVDLIETLSSSLKKTR